MEAVMAVLTDQARRYVTHILRAVADTGRPAYVYDPILAQVERVGAPDRKGTLSFAVCPPFKRKHAERAQPAVRSPDRRDG
jgi:hypothetical protein